MTIGLLTISARRCRLTHGDLQSKPWPETVAQLVDVAAGRAPAELVIRDGRWVNVYSGEIIPNTDVAIAAGRFALVGAAGHTIGPATTVIDAAGRYLVPGLCDGHMHVESGMVTATELARAVIPHGTTSMFVDPHEIGNVLGLAGVRLTTTRPRASPSTCSCRCRAACRARPGLRIPAPASAPMTYARP